MDTLALSGDSAKQDQIERWTLGTLLTNPDLVGGANAGGLCLDCFCALPNRVVWAAILALDQQGTAPTIGAVTAQLQTSGEIEKLRFCERESYLVDLTMGLPNREGIGIYVSHLCEQRNLRKARELIEGWPSTPGSISDLTAKLAALATNRSAYGPYPSAADDVEAIWSEPAPQLIPTGIAALDDKLLGGLMPESITTLIAGTGRGKTGLVIQIARYWLSQGWPVLFIVTELEKRQIYGRFLAQETRQPWVDVTAMGPDRKDYLVKLAREHLPGLSVHRWQQGQELPAIVAGYMAQHTTPPLIIVDHIGDLARALRIPERTATARIMEQLKGLIEQKLTVLAVSQVARKVTDGDGEKHGQDFEGAAKDAGEVENDSATVLYLAKDRECQPDGTYTSRLHIGKARGAPPDQVVEMRFNGAVGLFECKLQGELAPQHSKVMDAILKLTGGKNFTGIKQLQEELHLGQSKVSKLVDELTKAGHVIRDRKHGIRLADPEEQP